MSSEREWVAGSTQGLTGETASSDAARMQLEQGSRVYAAAEAPIIYLNILSGHKSLRGGTEALRSISSIPRIVLICTLDASTRPLIFSIASNYRGGNCMERELGDPWEPLAPRLFVP